MPAGAGGAGDVRASGGVPRPARVQAVWNRRCAGLRDATDAGMATVEYAIVTVAAAAFAGLLVLILRSDEVRELLTGIVRGALTT
ncbi:DUF4244 domain-containing protein [Isoptericola sp. b490]|uniref:DUF4244 domain-containing protein n=1 Tax=Actinotalea lenta TaxID=3064654 RepID=UPI0027140AEF|nr:DUF4244 domain-containing protein [Isoptericola sp. b490]MDO8121758.1 DUF4244 domain-containing protein [Isoptericola sp. b490]